ncbi:AAA family ATPase [Capnocytophaga canis]|uniref:AAA family ATPase n=1 Tax=Capnocytophaga canis TaxID=1848903 RepID=UPI002174D4FE|nr:AAA family ATPase [Capnocytophaga canis]
MNEIVKFKHLLEYFVTHLEWCQNEDVNFIGYEKYIKNLVEKNKFRKAGQGYNDDKIQLQIKEWENYSIGKICINVSGYTPNRYISEFCYLNWLGTGINICAKWESSNIKSLYLTEYRDLEGNKQRTNLGVEYSLSELKLFQEGITTELETLFEEYKNCFIQFKQMKNIQKTLNLLKYKKQIILQGPPGTGKTREAKELAKALLKLKKEEDLKNNDQFQIIQFHPSYSYEDFVRGIVAKPNSNGDGITYEAENKILVKIAERAWKNYKASSFGIDESDSISKDIWIDDKFNDFKSEIEKDVEEKEIPLSGNITIFKVDYDSFRYGKDWQTPSRINFADFKNIIKAVLNGTYSISSQQIPKEISLHAHYRYTYYNALLKFFFDKYKYEEPVTKQDLKKFVLIIDEINRANLSSVLGELIYALEYRGEAVDSMYAVDGSNKITLPPNLYIIGTMNTADRSVGHIDYAIRRRFAFVDVLPRDLSKNSDIKFEKEKFTEVSELFIKNFDLSKDYSKEKIEKSDYLSNEFDVKDVWLGHSYFIEQYEKDNNGEDIKDKPIDFRIRLEYEIKPILREYVKDGVLKELAINEINKL